MSSMQLIYNVKWEFIINSYLSHSIQFLLNYHNSEEYWVVDVKKPGYCWLLFCGPNFRSDKAFSLNQFKPYPTISHSDKKIKKETNQQTSNNQI